MLDSVLGAFKPQLPRWACEFTSHSLIVAGVDSRRNQVRGKQVFELSPGAVNGSLSEKNLAEPDRLLETLRLGLAQAGFKGSELGVVIPDDSARVTFLAAENMPSRQEERETFVRWKLKKTMPFDVDSAQVAFKVLKQHPGDGKTVDVLVALSPRSVINEYVDLLQKADIHAGFVIPSTLSALNLFGNPVGDTLFVKIVAGCITTTVFQNQRVQFYRRVAEMPIYDAVYPTIMYYQDKLAGHGIESVVVCSGDGDRAAREAMKELQEKLGVPVRPLEPKNVEDIFKPALGAVGWV